MAVNPNPSLPTALASALGAITSTRTAVKKAAAEVYTPPADQVPGPAAAPAGTPAGA